MFLPSARKKNIESRGHSPQFRIWTQQLPARAQAGVTYMICASKSLRVYAAIFMSIWIFDHLHLTGDLAFFLWHLRKKKVLQVRGLIHWIAFSCQPWQNLTLFPWGTEVGFPDNCTQLKPLMHSECNKRRGSIIVGGSGLNLPELQKLLKGWQRPTTPIWQHKKPFDMANLEEPLRFSFFVSSVLVLF